MNHIDYKTDIPYISVEQMIEVDRLMIEHYGILLIQMMENAGRDLSELLIHKLLSKKKNISILVLCGSGGNGGGAMVGARHLSNKGFDVDVVFSKNINELSGIPLHQAKILQKLPVTLYEKVLPKKEKEYDMIIDGIIGYSLKGAPRGFSKEMIDYCNRSKVKVLSLDMPSGLGSDNLSDNSSIVKATYTMTLALPKVFLKDERFKRYIGKLFLADISVPSSLYKLMGLDVSDKLFSQGSVIEI